MIPNPISATTFPKYEAKKSPTPATNTCSSNTHIQDLSDTSTPDTNSVLDAAGEEDIPQITSAMVQHQRIKKLKSTRKAKEQKDKEQKEKKGRSRVLIKLVQLPSPPRNPHQTTLLPIPSKLPSILSQLPLLKPSHPHPKLKFK